MKLSEAIKVGSQKRAPAEEGWNDIGPDGEMRSCPIFSAAEAYGLLVVEENKVSRGPNWIDPKDTSPGIDRGGSPSSTISALPDEWYAVLTAQEIPPCSCQECSIPGDIIILAVHLYDVHQWSREAIADWIEGVEMRIDQKQWIAAKGPNKPWTPGMKW